MHSRNRAGFDHSNSDLPDCHQELDSSNHISLPKAKHPGSFTLECFVAIARFFILCFLTVPGLLPCDSDFSEYRVANGEIGWWRHSPAPQFVRSLLLVSCDFP
jgi:hypothetical protein